MGVTLNLSLLKNIVLSPDNTIASIGLEALWGDVYRTLDPFNVAVPGGRADTYRSGNSLFAARYGFVCDNVKIFGFRFALLIFFGFCMYLLLVLKGGSNNFGIVTRFDLIQAITVFTDEIANDEFGSVVRLWTYSQAANASTIFNAHLTGGQDQEHPPPTQQGIKDLFWALQFQPLPWVFTDWSKARGGNILGLDRTQDNLLFKWDGPLGWSDALDDEVLTQVAAELIRQVAAYLRKVNKPKDFIYLNYASSNHTPISGYGLANVKRMQAASAQYDPNQVFQRLVPDVGLTSERIWWDV
ncbi:MAG: hypothetical protein M1817_001808 [Caeruleum heppii]|nr:MAG: hypothetical protein M1817_001808 [Caeruleum heppii]